MQTTVMLCYCCVCRAKFKPYVESSYKAVIELLDYPSADTRRAAVSSVAMLCRAVWKLPSRMYNVQLSIVNTNNSAVGYCFTGQFFVVDK